MSELVTAKDIDLAEFDYKDTFHKEWYDAEQVDSFLDSCKTTVRTLSLDALKLFKNMKDISHLTSSTIYRVYDGDSHLHGEYATEEEAYKLIDSIRSSYSALRVELPPAYASMQVKTVKRYEEEL